MLHVIVYSQLVVRYVLLVYWNVLNFQFVCFFVCFFCLLPYLYHCERFIIHTNKGICIITFYDIEIMKTIWASFYLFVDQQAPYVWLGSNICDFDVKSIKYSKPQNNPDVESRWMHARSQKGCCHHRWNLPQKSAVASM